MQQRQQMKEQMGLLEEQLELLGSVASLNEQRSLDPDTPPAYGTDLLLQEAMDTLHGLYRIAQEQQLLKSVSASDFLSRIIGILVHDAHAQGFDLAVSHFGEGSISMEMAELVLGAILAGLRASLKSFRSVTKEDRAQRFLFPTFSFYLEVRASAEEIQFRLVDDGCGYEGRLDEELASEKQFQKLRSHIARSGGWFSRASLRNVGGLIEFKVPLPRSRFETLRLCSGDCEALLPTSCIAEVIEGAEGTQLPAGAVLTQLQGDFGLAPTSKPGNVLIRVGMADFQFWISCDSAASRFRSRRVPADDLVSDDSWFRYFGLYHDGNVPRILPLLDGDALMRFHSSGGQGT